MAVSEELCIPREVHNYGRGSTYRNDGKFVYSPPRLTSRRLTSRRPRYCTNPTLQEPERRISWLMETS